MGTISRFEEIEAWKNARELTKQIYQLSAIGAFSRDFGLKDQIRRAAVSIMSNIAEGFESQTQALFIKYLGVAKASAGELRSQLYVALDLGYISPEDLENTISLAEKVSRQIYRFVKYLQSQSDPKRI
ncbi:MAG: four helix bundle protein [Anaerolineales bacterium]|nr:four helix bundle protein [Anaerolineales bacterium]